MNSCFNLRRDLPTAKQLDFTLCKICLLTKCHHNAVNLTGEPLENLQCMYKIHQK